MIKKDTMKFLFFVMVAVPGLVFGDISQPIVAVSPNQTNNFAQYTITSTTGNGNTNLDANVDVIYILFNASTNVPNSITPSLITVNNVTVNSVTVNGQLVAITTPVNIGKNGTPFTVVIDASAHIKNPQTAGK